MSQNTIKCIHCGTELPKNQVLCTQCGCRPFQEHTITINRKSAFTGSLVPLVVNIYNESVKESISINNGMTDKITLPAGEYNFKMTLGVVMGEFKVNVTKDTTFEAGIKLGMFVNKLYLQEIC